MSIVLRVLQVSFRFQTSMIVITAAIFLDLHGNTIFMSVDYESSDIHFNIGHENSKF